ncbi:MAG: pitrilysin family protein [Spirochaetales bacterium]|jgi:zinc protease
MKSHNAKKVFTIAFAVIVVLAGMAEVSAQASPQAAARSEPQFVRDNLPSFFTYTLKNGIPLYVKRSGANRVRTISFVLRGGSLVTPAAEAGWPKLAFSTMARASANYPYETVTALLDATSSSISASSQFEFSTLSLNALDKYFDQLLPIWSDMIVAPNFARPDFDQARSEVELAIQAKDQNPWSVTNRLTNEKYFEGHPYSTNPDGTEISVAGASVESMKTWYAGSVSADRIFVVAVGDFDIQALGAVLESTIGRLPNLRLGPVPLAPPFGRDSPGRLFTEDHDQSRGVAYLRGDFAAPAPGASDYMATNLAMKLFSDLLFSVVRDKYGAVYTPSAGIRAFSANYGSISIYKTAATDKIKAYIDEAAAVFASGRCVSVDPSRPGEEAKYMKIADALETYKRMFINEYFDAIRTNAAIAGLMISSVVTAGDPSDWVRDIVRIAAAKPEEVRTAFSDYILGGSFTWVAVGDPGLLAKLQVADFASFKTR